MFTTPGGAMVRHLTFAAAAALLVIPVPAPAQTAADREAVRQAALDYVEGIYQVQPERIERSVHAGLVKRGFARRGEDTTYQPMSQMTFEQLVALARNWNRDGKQDTRLKEVILLDVQDITASAKVVATWGTDYMQLAKFGDRWKIVNILWQSPQAKTAPNSAAR
jgi:hypothetical protein